MGAFFGSIQIRSDERDKIKAAAERIASAMKIDMLLGPSLNGWIGVYPNNNGQDERVAAELAKLVGGYVMHILLHDDDIFAYWLHHNGELIDSYHSTPGYFGAKDEPPEQKMAGQPELFRPIIGDKVDRLAKILDRGEPRPVFMSDKFEAFAELLNIPHALASYEYILEGDVLDADEREQFEQVAGGGEVNDANANGSGGAGDSADINQQIRLSPRRHLLAGLLRIQRHDDWAGALENFNSEIELHPNFAEAYNLRGLTKQKLGDIDGALLDFEKAVALEPDDGGYLSHRGDIRRRKNDLTGALADYDRSLELEPNDPRRLNNRGLTKKNLGDLAGALADFERAMELDRYFVAAVKNRGDVKRAMKDFKAALADYDIAIQLRPDSPVVLNNRALCRVAVGDFDEAILDYDRAIQLGPKPSDLAAIIKNRESALRRKNARNDE